MCGIIGIVGSPGTQVATSIYDALLVLQHRGQDAAGIVTSDSERISVIGEPMDWFVTYFLRGT